MYIFCYSRQVCTLLADVHHSPKTAVSLQKTTLSKPSQFSLLSLTNLQCKIWQQHATLPTISFVITNTVNKTQLCTLLYLPGYCCLSSGCLRLQYSTAEMVAFSPRSSSHSHFSMFRRLEVLLPTSSSGATCCQAGCSPPIPLSSSKIRTNYCQWKHVKCLVYLSWHHKIKENRVIPLYHVWH